MKLISSERSIGIYNVTSEERLRDIVLNVTVSQLMEILTPSQDDQEFIDGYILGEEQLTQLSEYAVEEIIPDFSKYFYVLQCLGNYDWNES
ncbi:MAG: hypothetical protein JSS82_13545 [Bacteroidetes bacterium]|nr:hypothetical protein [Bacteroidota bacterium]